MIHHEEEKYTTDEIQATVVTVKTKRQAITFAAAYCPPWYNLKKTDYLNFLSSLEDWRELQRKEYTLGVKADHTQRKRAIQ
jgi:hypothetical protein